MLDCTDVCDDPLTSAVGLANYTLADELLKLTLAHFQIGTDNHTSSLRPENC